MISAINFNEAVEVYTEAVFTNGKATLKPIVDQFQVIKDLLESQIKDHRETAKDAGNAMAKAKIGEITGKVTVKAFNPEAFWRNTEWKKLEDIIQKMFGLRVCKINPYNEKYNMGKDEFESKELNAYVYRRTRYPVEGLITEKGFFDKSHSLDLDMYISLGLLRYLTASEIVAVMLHEFGHSIDPALCDIKYTGTNILCKYITDRKGAINKEEQRLISDRNKVANESKGLIILPFFSMIGSKIKNGVKNLFSAIKGWFTKKEKKDENITEGVLDIFQSSSKRQDIKLKKLQKIIEQDMIEFNRKEYSEAFADNFARMYGFGAEMASALKKLSKDVDTKISRIDKERRREDIIYNIAESAIKDVHKTDVHRIKALIKEYQDDIKDPNTPAEVKKQLEADVKEVELVLDQFMNDFSEFQNRINKLISEELDKMNITDDEVKKESAEYTERSKFEFKHPHEKSSLKSTNQIHEFRNDHAEHFFGLFKHKEPKETPLDISDDELNALFKQCIDKVNADTAIDSVEFTTSAISKYDTRIAASKIGGIPFWPKGKEWPKENGKNALCIVQLNFEEFPNLPDYPTDGILQIFTFQEVFVSEIPLYVYHPKSTLNTEQGDVPFDFINSPANEVSNIADIFNHDNSGPNGVVYLTAGKKESQPTNYTTGRRIDMMNAINSIIGPKLGKTFKSEKDLPPQIKKLLDNDTYQLKTVTYPFDGTRIGGYPFLVQFDDEQLYDAYIVSQGKTLLFQLDSGNDIMLGDLGTMQFYVDKSSIKNKTFTRGEMYSSCY